MNITTRPRVIAAIHVREGDEIATFASTGELLPTVGALANAEELGDIAWHTVTGACVVDWIAALVTDGPSWPRLGQDATVIVRERIAA